jgi:uncharacterized protein (DUF2164 family)
MSGRKPIWDVLSIETKKKCLDSIISYFLDERDEKIGLIAAEQVLDTIIEPIFSEVYNKGVTDAQSATKDKLADLDIDLDLLKISDQT